MKTDRTDNLLLMLIIILILIIIALRKCEKEIPVTIQPSTTIDYNTRMDSISDIYASKLLRLSDSLDILKNRLKERKTALKIKYIRLMDTVEENCEDYVDAANEIILGQDRVIQSQDSVIAVQDTMIIIQGRQIKTVTTQKDTILAAYKNCINKKPKKDKFKKLKRYLTVAGVVFATIMIIK